MIRNQNICLNLLHHLKIYQREDRKLLELSHKIYLDIDMIDHIVHHLGIFLGKEIKVKKE